MRKLALTILIVALAGCAAQQQTSQRRYFVSYEKMLADSTFQAIRDRPDIPWDVKFAYADCSAAYAMTLVTPEERARLDAYARQQIELPNDELQSLDSRINARGGGAMAVDDLSGICPEQIPAFKQYIHG